MPAESAHHDATPPPERWAVPRFLGKFVLHTVVWGLLGLLLKQAVSSVASVGNREDRRREQQMRQAVQDAAQSRGGEATRRLFGIKGP